jgi:hypothetical protein
MGSHSWGFGSGRPRNRLRKRDTIRGFRKYYNFATGNSAAIYDKNRVLGSGYTVSQAWGCLDKAWVGFRATKRLENYSDMKLYASIIQRIEKELNIEVNDFPELGLGACELKEDENEDRNEDEYVEFDLDNL